MILFEIDGLGEGVLREALRAGYAPTIGYPALREAIGTPALHLAFQPKMSFATRRVTGVEALLRWTHDVYGVISPDQFIPVAEASGLIRPASGPIEADAGT